MTQPGEYYCDIHAHFLPGVDDGSRSVEETLQMLRMAYDEGIRILTATPHYSRHTTPENALQMQEAYRKIKQEAQEKFPDLKICLGNEILYSYGTPEALESRQARTLNNGRYILIEFRPPEGYEEVYSAFQILTRAGYRPIVAHVERLECLWKQWERMEGLKSMGVLFQMNTQSLLGGRFNGPVRYCRRLVSEGYIDLLGTDAHNCEHRPPIYREAAEWVRRNCGEETLRRLSWDNPRAVLKNQYLK